MAKTITVKHVITANTCKTTVRLEDGIEHMVKHVRKRDGSFTTADNKSWDEVEGLPSDVFEMADTLEWLGVCQYLKD